MSSQSFVSTKVPQFKCKFEYLDEVEIQQYRSSFGASVLYRKAHPKIFIRRAKSSLNRLVIS